MFHFGRYFVFSSYYIFAKKLNEHNSQADQEPIIPRQYFDQSMCGYNFFSSNFHLKIVLFIKFSIFYLYKQLGINLVLKYH